MSPEADPLANLPPYESDIVGSWRPVKAVTPAGRPVDPEQKQISHFTVTGHNYCESTDNGYRIGTRMCGYSISLGLLITSCRLGSKDELTWQYRDYDAFLDDNLLVLASVDRSKIWWFEKLEIPPPYACGFVNPQGRLEYREPTEDCGKLGIAWRKNTPP